MTSLQFAADLIDDGTLDTVISSCGEELRYSVEFAADYRDESGCLDLDRFIDAIEDDLWDIINEKASSAIERIVDARVEYEETHDDAGSGYAHLPHEGFWPDQYEKLANRAVARGIITEQQQAILPHRYCDGHDMEVEMRPGHVFSSGSYTDGQTIDSYAVGEVEVEIEASMLADVIPDTDVAYEALCRQLKKQDHCIKKCGSQFYAYAPSDSVGFAVVTDECIERLMNDAIVTYCRLRDRKGGVR